MAKIKVDLARRAEIGAARRSRTHGVVLRAARELFGREGGRATRVEDICKAASISRGTLYNHFPSFDALQAAVLENLNNRFDDAVHLAFEHLSGPAERTCAAIRFYLTHAVEDHQWGWGMVNTGMGIGFFPVSVAQRVLETIQDGIDAGDFTIPTAEAGRDVLLGAGLAAATTLLNGQAPDGHIENVAVAVLMALGLPAERALALGKGELMALPAIEPETGE